MVAGSGDGGSARGTSAGAKQGRQCRCAAGGSKKGGEWLLNK